MQEDSIGYEEAIDFISYNTIRSLPYAGQGAPIIIWYKVSKMREYDKEYITLFINKIISNLRDIFNSKFIKINPQYYYTLTKTGYKKDENYITGIKLYFQSPDGIVFYTGILDTEQFYRNINDSFNGYFVDKYTAKFKHDILDLLIKYAVNEEYT